MLRSRAITPALALASAATLASLSCGALLGSAAADPGQGHQDHQDHGQHAGQDHGHQGQSGDHGHQGQSGDHGHQGQSGDHSDPKGNNGTVKIAGPGDAVGTPSNNPHPGCTFAVEWFGYDEGQDVVSTVTFAAQAPTSDVVIGGTAPSSVFVGGDPAGGGTDLDGRQAYTLTFSGGAPHPKQGYHVKVTIATPHSLGNDTKTKVFWVEPCPTDGAPDDTQASGDDSGDSPTSAGASSGNDQSTGVEGIQATAGQSAEDGATAAKAGTSGQSTAAGAAVPTSVDAGEDGPLGDWARSPWPLVAVAGGLTLGGAAVARRKSRA